MIELPKLKHKTSGLTKSGKTWRIIYYEDSKMRTVNTLTGQVDKAVVARDKFYKAKLKEGATYKGSSPSAAVMSAIQDPDGDACIYVQVSYRVLVDGVHVTTTTDKELAKQRRAAYIAENYLIQ